MRFFEHMVRRYQEEQFNPSWLSILYNPFYFVRKGIAAGIRRNAHYMSGVMLDFGCGSKPYRPLFDVSLYIGLDVYRTGSQAGKRDVDVLYGGTRIPFRDESFDCVLSSEVLEHVFDIDDTLGELRRVLKKGGILLLTVPFVWNEHESPHDFGRYTSYGIKYLVEKHGYEIVRSEKSTTFVETVAQMWNCYLVETFLPERGFVRAAMVLFLISPFTVLGIVLSWLFPPNHSFYHNNILVVRRRADGVA